MAARAPAPADAPHIPVLLDPLIAAVSPVHGTWLDGTFGAGGYTRALLESGAAKVIAVDRDPTVFERARGWVGDYGDRLALIEGEFAELDALAAAAGAETLDGVVLDVGVSSMQIDEAARGFSFAQDGPLDMRMSGQGRSAADLVATLDEGVLADIIFQYGEDRAARRIARAIAAARAEAPITTTGQLAAIVARCLPRPKPGQPNPATRTFQALRIAVNDELGQLAEGLAAAERALAPGGLLAVVTFHSLEDRIVKRFIQDRSSTGGGGSRHAPAAAAHTPRFERVTKKAVTPDAAERAANPRARSAKLRVARRTDAPAEPVDRQALGLPRIALSGEI